MPRSKSLMRGNNRLDSELSWQVLLIADRLLREQGLSQAASLDAPLDETGLGFDSMAQLDLFAAIEKECLVAIPLKYWGPEKPTNLAGLIRVVVKKG